MAGEGRRDEWPARAEALGRAIGRGTLPDGWSNDGHMLAQLMSRLDRRERRLINTRFGLISGHPLSLEQTAQVIGRGYTRERVRMIEARALARLRGERKPYTPRQEGSRHGG